MRMILLLVHKTRWSALDLAGIFILPGHTDKRKSYWAGSYRETFNNFNLLFPKMIFLPLSSKLSKSDPEMTFSDSVLEFHRMVQGFVFN